VVSTTSDAHERSRWGVRLAKQGFRFDAAHFIVFGDGSREPLHGHNYQVRLCLEGLLDADGMVADFTRVKPIVRGICDEFDHLTILQTRCERLRLTDVPGERDHLRISGAGEDLILPRADLCLLPLANTSVELLAGLITDRVIERLAASMPEARITQIEVEVEETPGQSAFCRRELP
jgi:6-pyruvoyltetrahydropterin/6-carboxytetrahydropterin synthase